MSSIYSENNYPTAYPQDRSDHPNNIFEPPVNDKIALSAAGGFKCSAGAIEPREEESYAQILSCLNTLDSGAKVKAFCITEFRQAAPIKPDLFHDI